MRSRISSSDHLSYGCRHDEIQDLVIWSSLLKDVHVYMMRSRISSSDHLDGTFKLPQETERKKLITPLELQPLRAAGKHSYKFHIRVLYIHSFTHWLLFSCHLQFNMTLCVARRFFEFLEWLRTARWINMEDGYYAYLLAGIGWMNTDTWLKCQRQALWRNMIKGDAESKRLNSLSSPELVPSASTCQHRLCRQHHSRIKIMIGWDLRSFHPVICRV